MALTQLQLDAAIDSLRLQIASAKSSLQNGSKSITYQDLDQQIRALEALKSERAELFGSATSAASTRFSLLQIVSE